jgi:hypothetical protein
MDAAIIQELLDGHYVCPACLDQVADIDACPHRQAELEEVLGDHFQVRYVMWHNEQVFEHEWPWLCLECRDLINECAVCGLDCDCGDHGPVCWLCMNEDQGVTVEEVLTAAIEGRVIVKYTWAHPAQGQQLTLAFL